MTQSGILPTSLETGFGEVEEAGGSAGRGFAAAEKDTGVDGADGIEDRTNLDAAASGHCTGRHQGNDRDSKPGFDHADDGLRAGGFQCNLRRQPALVKGVEDMLPSGRTTFIQDERLSLQLRKPHPAL